MDFCHMPSWTVDPSYLARRQRWTVGYLDLVQHRPRGPPRLARAGDLCGSVNRYPVVMHNPLSLVSCIAYRVLRTAHCI